MAAGIGGGSADGAATLKALCRLWNVRPAQEALRGLALSLGADVPVCLEGKPAFIGGIGEKITPAPSLPECWFVLVNPGKPLSTPAVFKAYGESGAAFRPIAPPPFSKTPENAAALAAILARSTNDLALPAKTCLADVGEVLSALEKTKHVLLARMSGSGATCFGLYEKEESAVSAAAEISARHRAWWVRPAALLSAGESL